MTIRAAKNLQRLGCVKGSKIIFFTGDIVPLQFGAICLGCPLVLPSKATQADYEYSIKLTEPEYAVCDMECYSAVRESFSKLNMNAKIITVDGQMDDSIPMQSILESADNESFFE